ncbi:2'-5' RNA ligase family protein [Nocardioides yefusunii]|uniref:2'-5' RNA ligase family protein n=1 Tax=Nocardioides yefusunii TaxID=2500546 RepID=A0ABW1R185_9ACTN|nr:2'-5' RNA ligase family protein [Nocardioides yefusunii]
MTTIGVAVAIPEPWGTRLQEYRTSLGDTTAHTIPTHITLIPPTEIDAADLPAVEQHLAEVSARHAAYRVHLRGTGTFRPVSPVVFVQVSEGIPGCEMLAADLRSGPLAVDLDFPYHPHVTIAHHLDDAGLDRAFTELADFDCAFSADEFHLYVHDDVTGWVPSRAFALQ